MERLSWHRVRIGEKDLLDIGTRLANSKSDVAIQWKSPGQAHDVARICKRSGRPVGFRDGIVLSSDDIALNLYGPVVKSRQGSVVVRIDRFALDATIASGSDLVHAVGDLQLRELPAR